MFEVRFAAHAWQANYGKHQYLRVYDIYLELTRPAIHPANRPFDSLKASFHAVQAYGVTEIGPKSSPRGHVPPFLSLYSAPVAGRPMSLNW
jgi:hypothetical protein